MVQDFDEMKFCSNCKMNVFPSRPKFNVRIFIISAIIMLIIFTLISIISASIFSGIFLFLFFMWFFMFLNPYVFYFGLKKKENCPKCYQEVIDKNLDYKPFGDKVPEIFKTIGVPKKEQNKWYCPHCGIPMYGAFCTSCGQKFEIYR